MTAPERPAGLSLESQLFAAAADYRGALEQLYAALAQYFDGKGGMLELTAATRRAEIVLGLRADEE